MVYADVLVLFDSPYTLRMWFNFDVLNITINNGGTV